MGDRGEEGYRKFVHQNNSSLRNSEHKELECFSTENCQDLKRFRRILSELQIMNKAVVDGVFILSKLVAPILNLDKINESLKHLRKCVEIQDLLETYLQQTCQQFITRQKKLDENKIKQEIFHKAEATDTTTTSDGEAIEDASTNVVITDLTLNTAINEDFLLIPGILTEFEDEEKVENGVCKGGKVEREVEGGITVKEVEKEENQFYIKVEEIDFNSRSTSCTVSCTACKKSSKSKTLLNSCRKETLFKLGEKPFSCDDCDKRFSHKGHLRDHLIIHTGQKPFQCEVCGLTFARLRSKISHMANHLQEKPFKCEVCEKGFGIKRVLTKHMRTHTGEKNFKCDICNKCFVSNFVLKVHKRKHTGERPYKCDQCFKMFSQNSSLTDHMRIHTGEKPFKCDQCVKEFSTKSILRKHLLSHARQT